MRVLGYSSIAAGDGLISPAPVDCFEYAKLAASKMLIPGTHQQPVEERERMAQEILNAESTDYPSERAYKKVWGPFLFYPYHITHLFTEALSSFGTHTGH